MTKKSHSPNINILITLSVFLLDLLKVCYKDQIKSKSKGLRNQKMEYEMKQRR